MASYLSTQVASQVEVIGQAPTHQVETFSITFATVTFSNTDTVTLCQIPLFCSVLDFYLATSATLGSTITWSIGTTTTAAQFASASTFGQGAATQAYAVSLNGFVANSLPTARFTTQTTATLPSGLTLLSSGNVADYLVMTASAAGGASTTATLKGYIRYTLNTVS